MITLTLLFIILTVLATFMEVGLGVIMVLFGDLIIAVIVLVCIFKCIFKKIFKRFKKN